MLGQRLTQRLPQLYVIALLWLPQPRAIGYDLLFHGYDLGNLGEGCSSPVSIAYGINDIGVVVGLTTAYPECDYPEASGHAFAWFNGVMTDIGGESEGADIHYAVGISEDSEIIFGGGGGVVTVIDKLALKMPVPVGCSSNSTPRGANSAGTFGVGACWDSTDQYGLLGALYSIEDLTSTTIPPPPNLPLGESVHAYDVNNSGVVVGYYGLEDGTLRAFFYRDGRTSELVNSLGGEPICADGISNSGFIVGSAETNSGYCAMRYDMQTSEMMCLGDGIALDVNDRGDAVGVDLGSVDNAVLYKDGEVLVLNEFLPPYMLLPTAYAINSNGWIVGEAFDWDFNYWGWLLVPLYPKGDYDGDDDVDLHDFGHFQECYAAEPYQGPEGGLHVGCSVFDFDDDVDLDGDDFAAFQAAFTGAITSGW